MPKKQKLSSLIDDLNNEFWPADDLDDDLDEMKIHCGEYVPDSNELIADSLEVGGL
jgi:hypothetical protein